MVQRKKLIFGASVGVVVSVVFIVAGALLLNGSQESGTNEAIRPATQPSQSPSIGIWQESEAQPSGISSPLPSDVFDSNGFTVESTPGIESPTKAQPSTLVTIQSGRQPSRAPTETPSEAPSGKPTDEPSTVPVTASPSRSPVKQPSSSPTNEPSSRPSDGPSTSPSWKPSDGPSLGPSSAPTPKPSKRPTKRPTSAPTQLTVIAISPQTTQLIALDGLANDRFGKSVAVFESTIVVGADQFGKRNGYVDIYTRNGNSFSHQAKLLAPDGVAGDRFGFKVAIYGNTIAVSSPEDDMESGSVHIFVRNNGLRSWKYEAKLLASDGTRGDYFGQSVAIYGDTVVVGSDQDDNRNGEGSGSVHIFVRSGQTWSREAKLILQDGEPKIRFGHSVAIYGDTLVVGAHKDRSAHVYVRNGKTWSYQDELLPPEVASVALFGTSVAIFQDTVVVGAPFDSNQNSAGSAHVYLRDGRSWLHQTKLLGPSGGKGSSSSSFGNCVAVHKARILVSDEGNGGGSLHVFNGRKGSWIYQDKFQTPGGGTKFSSSLSIDQGAIVAGSPDDRGTEGSAYVFE